MIPKQSNSLADHIPFWHFHGDYAVFADGSFGVGFKLSGFDLATADNSQINEFATWLETLLTSIREGLKLQVFYRLTSNLEERLNEHARISTGEGLEYEAISKSRFDFLSKKIKEGVFCQSEIYLFLRSQPHQLKKRKIWESEKQFQTIAQTQFDEYLAQFERDSKQVSSVLAQAGLSPEQITSKTWFNLLFEYLNFGRATSVGIPAARAESIDANSLVNQLALTDIQVNRDSLSIGGHYFRVLTLKTLPEGVTFPGMVMPLLKAPFHFWISQNITVSDQKKELDKLHIQRRLTHAMASGSGKMSDLESESKLGHVEELIGELLEGSEKIVMSDLNVMVWAKTLDELDSRTDEMLKLFRQLNQSEGIIETLPCLDAFMKSIPGVCAGLRIKKMKTSNASSFMPVFSSWEGNRRPVCLLPNRDGGLVSIDPFAPELPNWNGLIFGGSGSGKSYTILHLMLMFYGQSPRPKIVWIDNGASSKRFLEILGGEFVDLNIGSSIRLNMFDLEPGEIKPSPSKVKLILAVLETILKEKDKPELPKREKALLEEAIFLAYEKCPGKTPQLSDLKKILAEHSSPVLKGYADILFSWTGNTAYGQLLDQPTNIALRKDVVAIETKGLDDYPDLQNVMLLLFTDFIKREASQDKSRPYLLILDEAWKLFQTASGLAFAMEAYRTFRKFFGGIWCISQNYKDFLFNEEIRNAVFPNTTSIFVLKQRGIDWKDFQERLQLNGAEVEAVKSLQVVKGEYSELFYIQDSGRAVLRVMPDRLGYLICTSDPKDKAMIEEAEKNNPGKTKLEVLQMLSNQNQEVI